MKNKPLRGVAALVTSGPTHEPIDPVRYLGNRSSGRQGHAIAVALRDAGARVMLVTGPVALPDPEGMTVVKVRTAREMLAACKQALPVKVAVCAAAVADWRVERVASHKIKKGEGPPALVLTENPDILKALSRARAKRPKLVIGFAAETENVRKNANAKRRAKGCDWIVANDVSHGKGFDARENSVILITPAGAEPWPRMSKREIAKRLVERVAEVIRDER